MAEYAKPRGTADILPDDALEWQFVEKTAQQLFESYQYREIRTPIFEHTEIFERGVGDTTDIVTREMYTFTDRGGRSVTLRPEGTAGVARAFVENRLYGGPLPAKLYYNGPMFRYETPQAGRYRQFYHYGVEVIGTDDPRSDAEVIEVADRLLRTMGIESFGLELNSVGCPVCRADHKVRLLEHLEPVRQDLCTDCQERFEKNPLRILDCKKDGNNPTVLSAPTITDSLCDSCASHFAAVKMYLDAMAIPYQVVKTMVRGLDYYTQTAFEFVESSIGAQSTILGGGRYNGLIRMLGGPDLPGIGFAGGIERLLLARAAHGLKSASQNHPDAYVIALGEAAREASVRVLHALRQAGISADADYSGHGLKAQLKTADRVGATFALLIGDDEVKSGTVAIRNMATKEQTSVNEVAVVATIADHTGRQG